MRRVEEEVDGDVVYVKYDSMGAHHDKLLRAFGIANSAAEDIRDSLERGPRLNVSLSHKQAATLANRETLSARTGVELDEAALRRAFGPGEDFEFEEDWRCELIGEDVRRRLHERALEAAHPHGITPYMEYFEDAEIKASITPGGLDPAILTDEDLERLMAHLGLTRSH
jgi:hypothetical protein